MKRRLPASEVFHVRGLTLDGIRGIGVLEFALWCWLPVYLLLMQKRIYGQGWLMTLVKYVVLGNLYFVLVAFAALYAVLAGVVSA